MNFTDTLIARARARPAKIILPESQDPRILTAATQAHQDGIAHCILQGDPAAITRAARAAGIRLPSDLPLLPETPDQQIDAYIAHRTARGKPTDATAAKQALANPAAQAAMRVADGTANGMVAGAATASADILRPALQIIGVHKNATIASSAFLMCFPDGMKVFADCALNIAPTAEQTAAIATQSAATARAFGLAPTVAFLSYSSAASGSGTQVEQTHTATDLFRTHHPTYPTTGPIQYDAAINPTIAKIKLPHDQAAGVANVLIFPDLQSGNITYKAVQQASNIIVIGPIMQGMSSPINDLSRGATVRDIYHTLAATTIQTHPTSA